MPISLVGSLHGEPFTFRPEFGLYSDNTPWAKGTPPEDMEIDEVVIRYHSLQDFIASMMYIRSTLMYMTDETALVIPFYPGARQDRSNPTGDILSTKSFVTSLVDEISPFFSEVLVFDMHSPAYSPQNLVNITPSQILVAASRLGIQTNPTEGYYDTIIAPDHGAEERAAQVASIYHTPIVVADKVRDVSTGQITHYDIDTTKTEMKKVLVVDDICDGGATFNILADSLPLGTEKHLFVTHGLFAHNALDRLMHRYDRIITTNSVYQESGIEGLLTVIDLFAGVEV